MKTSIAVLLSLLVLSAPMAEAQFTYTTNNGAITLASYTGSGGAVVISNFVSIIGDSAFLNCTTLTGVTIPSSVTSIGSNTFFGTALTSITIPGSVTNIGLPAFIDSTRLTAITVNATNPFFSSVSGVLFDKGTNTLIQYPGGINGSYAIPGSVTSIGAYAFDFDVGLTAVTIPSSVTNIGLQAFYDTSLTSVTIPGSVTSIGTRAFGTLHSTVITVNATNPFFSSFNGALFDKGTNTMIQYPGGTHGGYTIPASVTSIGTYAFDDDQNMTSVTIPNSVTSIGNYAFHDCYSLTGITIPGIVTNIGQGAFEGCAMTSVAIPGTVTSIGLAAFSQCSSLTAITVDPTNPFYSSVNGVLFDKNTNTLIQYPGGIHGSYTIPGSVTILGVEAFVLCTNLISVTIPNSITNIGVYAFAYCSSLTKVYFAGNAPTTDPTAFSSDNNATIYYLPGTMGWMSPFASRPAVLWNPMIQTGDATFGLQNNHFGFNITYTNNVSFVVAVCTNLANSVWTPLTTNTLVNGVFHFSEPMQNNNAGRFYSLTLP
jgi:hypothetical protein